MTLVQNESRDLLNEDQIVYVLGDHSDEFGFIHGEAGR